MIAAAAVQRDGLAPALDVVAIGLAEHRVFYDPSEERDSLLELLPAVVPASTRQSGRGRAFVGLLREGMELNSVQTHRGRDVAGFLDSLATDLRAAERTPGVKAIAREVRDPLRALADLPGEDLARVVGAVRAIDSVLDRAGPARALGRSVEHELGVRAYALLRDVADSRPCEGCSSPPLARPAEGAL